jgi:hypothetical protein
LAGRDAENANVEEGTDNGAKDKSYYEKKH